MSIGEVEQLWAEQVSGQSSGVPFRNDELHVSINLSTKGLGSSWTSDLRYPRRHLSWVFQFRKHQCLSLNKINRQVS